MKLLRSSSMLIIAVMFSSLWGCSGQSGTGDSEKINSASVRTKTVGGKVLENDFQLNASDTLDQGAPAVAYDNTNNRYISVWTTQKNDGTSDIVGKIFVPSGTGATTAFTALAAEFNISVASNNQTQPRVAYSASDDRYLVVWTDSRNSGYSQIYGQFVDKDGALQKPDKSSGTTADNFSISIHSAGGTPQFLNQFDPDILYNSADASFYVSWLDVSDKDQTDPLTFTLTNPCNVSRTFTYNLSGTLLDNNLVRYTTVDPAGGVIGSPNNWSVFASTGKQISVSTNTGTETFRIPYQESKPKLSFNPSNGEVFIGWSGIETSMTATFSFSQNSVSTTVAGVTTTTTVCSDNPVNLVATPIDTFPKIKFRRNQGLGVIRDYSFGGGITGAYYPSLSVDPNTNRIIIVWEENQQVLGQLVDASSFNAYGSTINISSGTGPRTSPTVAFDNVNQRFFAVWEDARNQSANISNIDIYGQFIDPQGNLSGGNTIITTYDKNQLAPAMAFGGPNFRQFLIVWKDGRSGGNSDIFGQLMEWSTLPQLVIADSIGNPIYTGSLDFGNVTTGSSKDIAIKIRNDGNSPLTISQPVATPGAPFSFVTPPPTTINPGTAYDMTIRFSPVAAGAYANSPGKNYQMTLNSNGGQAVLYFSGAGVGINPLTITTSSLTDILPTVATDTTIATLTGSGGVAPYTWSVNLPAALAAQLVFDTTTGVLTQKTGVAAIAAGSYSIPFTLTDSNTPVVSATRTLTLNVGSIGITTAQLTTWTKDSPTAYNLTLQSTGTTGVKTWAVPGSGVGSLPLGLSLNTGTGVISGTPTVSGSFTVLITLSDAGTGSSVTKSIPITINPAPSIITSSLASGVVAQAYSQSLSMAGGTLPVSWLLNGSLPTGLTFNTNTGSISGTPTADGSYTFAVTVTDVTQATVTKSFTIVVNKVLDITTATTLPSALSGQVYTTTLAGTGGTIPYTWSALSLPSGFVLNPFTGVLSATPNISGVFSFTATLTDANGNTASRTFTVTVNVPVTVTTSSLSAWTVNTGGYSQTLAANGGNNVFTWSISAGSGAGTLIPAPGLTMNATTGTITGTPSLNGTYTFTITATDGNGLTTSKQLSIVINPALSVTTTALGDGAINNYYSQQLFSNGGTAPVLWTITAGTLPTGLSLDNLSGIISGLPTVAIVANPITVRVTDASGATSSKNLTITIAAAPSPLSIGTASISDMKTGEFVSFTLLVDSINQGTPPHTWSIIGGAFPSGLTLNNAGGTVAGSPSQAGNYGVMIQVIDSLGNKATKIFTFKVIDPLLITSSTLKNGDSGQSYSDTVTAIGGEGAYVWSHSGLNAAGLNLSINSATGTITGTPTVSGIYPVTINIHDGASPTNTYSKTMSITISSAMTISTNPDISLNTPPNRLSMTVGTSGSLAFNVTGGSGNSTWSSTLLPTGLTLGSSGILSGTPASPGDTTVIVTVTDSTGRSQSQTITVSVASPVSISNTSLPAWTADPTNPTINSYAETLSVTGGAAGTITWSKASGNLPNGLTLNTALNTPVNGYPAGAITGKPTTAGNYNFNITATDSDGRSATKQFSIVINQPMLITTSSVATGTVGSLYSQPMTLFGGTASVFWSATGLPAGMSIDTLTGAIIGVPTVQTPTPAVATSITVTDASGASVTKNFSINVYDTISITQPITVNNGVVLSTYTLNLSASGGRTPYSWSVSSGTLPPGLSLGSGNGTINGSPTTAGVYTFSVTVQDPDSRKDTVALTILVLDQVKVTTASLAPWTVGQGGYSQQVQGTGGLGSLTWSISSGALPTGLTIDPNSGLITGTPTAGGGYTFTVQASDSSTPKLNGQKQLSILVKTPVVTLTQSVPDAIKGTSYSTTLLAAGGTTPYTWSVSTGLSTLTNLGLLLDATTGVISGVPVATTATPASFTVTVTDAAGSSANLPLTINVVGTLAITTNSLKSGTKGDAYSDTLAGSGGSAPYTWSISSGSLPAGLSLNASTGVVSGTATADGTSSFIVTLTDNSGRIVSKTLTITIGASKLLSFSDTATIPAIITKLEYGSILKGTQRSMQVKLVNGSTQSVSITAASLTGSAFSGPLPINVVIAAGQSTTITLAFTPTAIQTYSGTLSITDSTGAVATLNLSGAGTSAVVTLPGLPVGSATAVTSSPMSKTSLSLNNNPGVTVVSATQMQINNVTGASAAVTVTYDTVIPAGAVFYEVVNLVWTDITSVVTVSADSKSITYSIPDNDSRYDADPTIGTIVSPAIVVGTTTTGGGTTVGTTNNAPASGVSSGKSGCFIATAAYGSYLDPHVMVLRNFRDEVLLQSKAGTEFVKFYYHYSPPIANYIAQHDVLRVLMRFALTPVIILVKGGWITMVAGVLLAGLGIIRSYRRKNGIALFDAIKS